MKMIKTAGQVRKEAIRSIEGVQGLRDTEPYSYIQNRDVAFVGATAEDPYREELKKLAEKYPKTYENPNMWIHDPSHELTKNLALAEKAGSTAVRDYIKERH